jgi:hypothetical protein
MKLKFARHLSLQILNTKLRGNVSDLSLGRNWFESHKSHYLPWLKFFVAFFSSSKYRRRSLKQVTVSSSPVNTVSLNNIGANQPWKLYTALICDWINHNALEVKWIKREKRDSSKNFPLRSFIDHKSYFTWTWRVIEIGDERVSQKTTQFPHSSKWSCSDCELRKINDVVIWDKIMCVPHMLPPGETNPH